MTADRHQRIYAVVRRIPRGRVASYGQVADLAGLEGHARQVGYAMHALGDERVPWHRVVNARGEISARASDSRELQRLLLESEGVEFDVTGRIALERFGWRIERKRRIHAKDRIGSPDRAPAGGLRRKGNDGKGRRPAGKKR